MKGFKDMHAFLPSAIRKKQILVASIVIGTVLVITTAIVLFNDHAAEEKIPFDLEASKKKISIAKIAQGSKTEDLWLQQAEGDLKAVSKKVELQQIEKNGLEAKVSELERIIQTYEEERKAKESDTSIYDEVLRLREEMEGLKQGRGGSSSQGDAVSDNLGMASKIRTTELNLDGDVGKVVQKGKKLKLVDYLPAASYASAVLLSAADVSVGVNAQSNPKPVLMRIIGKAKSAAKDGVVQEIDLEGCMLTGAAKAELSSESISIRLVKMTCSREDGTAYETEVNGDVVSVGKEGIKGQVISREGDFVTQSFIAGLVSGFGEGATQRFATPTALPSGLATQRPEIKDIIGGGIGKGISSSSNRVAEYLINRAEQYQPVISIPSGIEVELVFNEGVYIDGRGAKNSNS